MKLFKLFIKLPSIKTKFRTEKTYLMTFLTISANITNQPQFRKIANSFEINFQTFSFQCYQK